MPNPRAVDPDYKVMHMRLRRDRGPASERSCVECGSTASDWAYDGQDPDEKVDEKGRRYSQDLDHYRPRCRSCHWKQDRDGKCRKGHPLDERNAYRHNGQVYCRTCRRDAMRRLRKKVPATGDKRASGGTCN